MKKMVRLTEKDLTRIVKRTINEMRDEEDMEYRFKKTLPKTDELSNENQKVSDTLFNLFGIRPKYGVTYAKNLKYIPYEYYGNDDDILNTFDLDLKKLDTRVWNFGSGDYVKGESDYTINIFIKDNGEVIFRFNSNQRGREQEKQISKSYTKDFKNTDEMIDFIKSEKLPEILSKSKYHRDKSDDIRQREKERQKEIADRLSKTIRRRYYGF